MAFTTTDLAAIDAAIASGELSVKFADRQVDYRSIDDLIKARNLIKVEIAKTASGGATLSPRYKTATFC